MTATNNPAVQLTIQGIVQGTVKSSKAVLIAFNPKHCLQNQWIPTSCIQAWNPATNRITIETWILDKKGVRYNV